MTQFFLKAKHWQLFILYVGLPLLPQIVTWLSNSTMGMNYTSQNSTFFLLMIWASTILSFLFTGIHFMWFWSVAKGINKLLPQELKLNMRRFNIFFFTPLVYFISIATFICLIIWNQDLFGKITPLDVVMTAFIIIFPLHLFSIFCIFHSIYFCAKSIKTAERQERVKFSDFAGDFFMIWFLPIGLWFLQPRINQLIQE